MKTRKLLSLVLSLLLVLSLMVPAFAEEAAAPKNLLDGKLVILHTNDVHGHGVSDAEHLGYARIAQMKKNLMELGASVLLLDAGDTMQGTPLVNLSQGKAAIEFMNAAGYDAMCIGNHELDWGVDNLMQALEPAEFPILACNLTDTVSGELRFPPHQIFEMENGMKVGVIGISTPETMTKAHPDKCQGITFTEADAMYDDVRKEVEVLRAENCDLIVALAHLGDNSGSAPNRSIDVIEHVEGIDVFVDGHSHTTIEHGDRMGSTLRVSTGEHGKNLGYVIVSENPKDGSLITTAGLYSAAEDDLETLMAVGSQLAADPDVEALVESGNIDVEKALSEAFGKTEVFLNGEAAPGGRTMETNLGDFTCDAMLWAAKQGLGEDKTIAAIINGGGIRASMNEGEITMKDLKTVFPFDNELTVLTVTGAELLEALEAATFSLPDPAGSFPQVSGIVYTVDTSIPFETEEQYPNSTFGKPAKPGSRVTIGSVAGEAFDTEALYPIVTNDYAAAGGGSYYVFRYAYRTSGYKTSIMLEDAIVEYTKEVLGGVIGEQYTEPQGRITIK